MNRQLDLFGYPLMHTCAVCFKNYNTKRELDKHGRIHHKSKKTRKTVNFILENYHMVAETIEVLEISCD